MHVGPVIILQKMIYYRSISICFLLILIQTIQALDQTPGYEYKAYFLEFSKDKDHTRSDIIDISELKRIRLGKNKYALNGTFTIHKDFPEGIKFSLITQKKHSSSGYQDDPNLTLKNLDACKAFFKDVFLVPSVIKHSNIPEECPYIKGTYNIYNLTLGPHNLPPYLPVGKYRTTTQWTYKGEPYITIKYITEIVRDYTK